MHAERVYRDEDWPHGLRCADCNVLFVEGMPVCERLEGMAPGPSGIVPAVALVVIVCAGCDLGTAA